MDRPTLQTPKSGRSRFSKALPAPPPELDDDRPLTASREPLPSVFSPFPPRKDSVSVKTSVSATTSPSGVSNLINSPLPALPPTNTMATSTMQTQTRTIPRKPVGLPSNPAPQAGAAAAAAAAAAKSKKMKRVSSISSLLSAYSNTSSDSVQRSSQGSIYTKDSEPSNSPEREGMNDAQPPLAKNLSVLPSNPYVDEVSRITDEMRAASLPPPPPPLKDPARPSTPVSARSTDPFAAYRSGDHDGGASASPSNLVGSSPQQREIWRRRASSKDGNILVPELKLSVSHGSTASTSQPPNPELLPPPPPVKNNNSNTTSPLPPRSASLPGRNIRPTKQPEPREEEDMNKLQKKLKELTTRGETAKGTKNPKDESIKIGGHTETSIPEGLNETMTNPMFAIKGQAEEPAKISYTWVDRAAKELDKIVPEEPETSSESPPMESAEKSISRRPVGASVPSQPSQQIQPSQFQQNQSSQQKHPTQPSQPEIHKKVSSTDLRPQNLGLPRFPRPSQSNTSLRSPAASPASQNVSETVKSQQPTPPAGTMPLMLPTDSNEPIKKPELFNMVTALNEPTISPSVSADSMGTRKPTRKVSKDVNTTALSDIGESAEHITPEQAERINEALSRFPRQSEEVSHPPDAVWPAAPISSKHHNCYVRHVRWVPVKNLNYPLACQTCGVQDTGSRKTCAWCNLRVCFKCHERLMGPYKADLKLLMENMETDQHDDKRREKGKQVEMS
ncbi:uncharacterized protein F4822DRAFT_367924 [Hypoxylon trugodes]|uniref:uncharacterized protein n=1 Tax=Hypoxylon trugodes TaxID=326681 RepID=UPI00219A3A32|nr:uncharacterized protein F4822DRAFT_367924 [Hypoxylon trugodes]KAI1384606.1 hypothetical protein F4822DRAFT_367924 [Hypoxylon trugodes]